MQTSFVSIVQLLVFNLKNKTKNNELSIFKQSVSSLEKMVFVAKDLYPD